MIRRVVVTLLAALLTAPALAQAAAPASAMTPGLNGRLVYAASTAGQNPKGEIFTVNPDGSGPVNLTNGAGSDSTPAWSPDGSKIAFLSDRSGSGLYVMNTDGSGAHKVASPPGLSGFGLAWSPDGAKLLFAASPGQGDLDLFTVNIDGTALTDIVSGPTLDFFAQWSPDGTKIAFMRRGTGVSGMYIAGADGTNATALSMGQPDEYPSFSPDGTTIVFDRGVPNANEIFTMKPDGTNLTQLTTAGGTNQLPRFSPDGGQIVFQTSKQAGPSNPTQTLYGIAVVNADGSSRRDLPLSQPQNWTMPDWQPISQPIAPGSPVRVDAVGGDGSATVSWAPGTYGGGLSVSGFTVYATPGGATASVGGNATSAVVSGLTNGVTYSFTVTATNSAGATGPPSDRSNAVMVHHVPVALPTVTTLRMVNPFNDQYRYPQLDIDWGPYSSSPAGYIEWSGGHLAAIPSLQNQIIDYSGYPPNPPKSYRAVACPNGCVNPDPSQPDPTWVIGPWFRPPVGDVLTRGGPAVSIVSASQTSPVQVAVNTSAHGDAPAFVIYRDFRPIDIVLSSNPVYSDSGPFGPASQLTYAAAACYSDCTVPAVESGFAQIGPWGPSASAANPSSVGTYFPLTPQRLLDTRTSAGGSPAPVGPQQTIDLTVTPAVPYEADAVAVNITVTDPTAPSYLTVWPADAQRPLASTLNFTPGQTVANFQVVRVGWLPGGGKTLRIFNNAGSAHVIVDVVGWYSNGQTTMGHRFSGVGPFRILDTRNGTGGFSQPIGQGASIEVATLGVGGVPNDPTVRAVMVNLTVTEPTAATYVTAWASDETRPLASNLNVKPGQTVPNLAIVRLGPDGKFRLFNNAGSTHVIADVVGYFSDGNMSLAGTRTASLVPTRILDTRDGTGGFHGKLGPGGVLQLQATGRGGVPTDQVSGVLVNVTVTEPSAASYLKAWPGGEQAPASNLNYVPGQTVANLVAVRVINGKFSIYNNAGTVHVIADVVGWF